MTFLILLDFDNKMGVSVEYVRCLAVELAVYEEDVDGSVLRLVPGSTASPLARIISPNFG